MNLRFIFILFLLPVQLFSQSRVEIYADTTKNDTIRKLVKNFTEQINNSQRREFVVRPLTSYKGTGIYFGTTDKGNQVVKPTAQLLKAGIEAFSINATGPTVQILGNCGMALGHGIFSYLDYLGYRFYFANTDWHIVPAKIDFGRRWSIVSAPAFNHRRIWYGYGTGSPIADADYNYWVLANRLGGAMNAYFGHAYGAIIARNRATFEKHPEWFYPVADKNNFPNDGKFDMSREDLVQFIIEDTKQEIERSLKNNTQVYKMISMAPSDGTGTCNTPACQKLGTITDRVFYLVNRVAKAIRAKYPATLIGCLAYGEYIAPPTQKIEPNVFVGITTAFNSSTFSTEQLVDEWGKKGAIVGIYDYFSWYAWDWDLPGQSIASQVTKMISTIKKYHAKGVKAYEGESSIGWISKGLGYYLAAKTMWDIKFDAEAAKKEFFINCFGKAAETMQKLWIEWENYSFTMVREGELARWIDYALTAEKQERDPRVAKRLFQVKSYLHYLFLYRLYRADGSEANLLSLLNYGYRKLDDGSVSGFPMFYEVANYAKYPGYAFTDKNAKWRSSSSPVSVEELNNLINSDRARLKPIEPVLTFKPASKFMNVPNLDRYKKMIADNSDTNNGYWMTNEWVMEIKRKGAGNYINFYGNYVNDPTNIKPHKIKVYPFRQDGNITGQPLIFYYEYNKYHVREKISLSSLAPGLYTVIIEDPTKVFQLSFSPSINYSNVMRPERPIKNTMLNYAFVYVPENVKRFNVIKASIVDFITPTGRVIPLRNNKAEEIQIEVRPGEAGLWRIKPLADQLYIEGIPPYLGTSARQMLIPAGIK
jgi:hypothetical protein